MQNVHGLGFKRAKNIGECAYDCDRDRDCARGLLCADKHKAELRAAGLDERHAYCGNDIYFAKGYNINPLSARSATIRTKCRYNAHDTHHLITVWFSTTEPLLR